MSEQEEAGEKSEEPTVKRLQDALNKGQVAQSREIILLASLVAFSVWLSFMAWPAAGDVVVALRDLISTAGTTDLLSAGDAAAILRTLGSTLAAPFLWLCALLVVAAVASAAAQFQPRFVADRIRPKLSHISIAKGAKRIFGKAGLAEFAKATTKIAIGTTVAVLTLYWLIPDLSTLLQRPAFAVFDSMKSAISTTLLLVCLTMIPVAIADFAWNRHKWKRSLRMTRKEVADEIKQAEGDPILKARLRSLSQDRSRQRMMDNVPLATLIVANPTHVAVALRYRHGVDPAPVVVAKGAELLCWRIREIAEKQEVPVFEQKDLARALYAAVEVDSIIPESFFQAVAKLINRINDQSR